MLHRVVLGLALLAPPQAQAQAQDCSAETQATGRTLEDRFDGLEQVLRRLVARGDGQDLRIGDLPDDLAASIPARPEAPSLPVEAFDADGRVAWFCDAFGEAGKAPAELAGSLDRAEAALGALEEALKAREAALARAEEEAQGRDVAGGPGLPDGDEPPAQAPEEEEGGDGAAEAEGGDGGGAVEGRDEAEGEGEGGGPEEGGPEDGGPEDEGVGPSVAADAGAPAPLPDPDNPNVSRRVIALPGATLSAEPVGSGEDGQGVPTFALFYVFEEREVAGDLWLEVGPSLRDGASGWTRMDLTLPWSTMLVMQFAPRGQRERVLFFEDATDLSLMIELPFYREEAADMHEALDAERARLVEDPAYEPDWDGKLVAVEPETAVTYDDQPYLLPILDWEETAFDGTVDTVLLRVAAIPADAEAVGDTDESSFAVSAAEAARGDDEYRTGIVFVIDTTISMSPFIERTRAAVEGFYDRFAAMESASFVSWGLVGFRDDVSFDPERLGYVTRVFQPLDPEAPGAQVLANLGQVEEAPVSNFDFAEDAYAGLVSAIEDMDWEPFDARVAILITDASAREGDDPRAAHPGLSAETLVEAARASGIVVIPVHLRSDAGERIEDGAAAERQYTTLGETGDIGVPKFLSVDAEDPDALGEALDALAVALSRNVADANAGEIIDNADAAALEPDPSGEDDPGRLAAIVTNEMFRAQLESLAAVGGGDAPAFLSGWASDRDLTDPSRGALEVSVYLTRDQLSSLDRQLDVIVEAFRSGGDDPEAFFDRLQELAADVATDPDAVRGDDRLAIQTLLPAFLANLPYRSEVLSINQDYWASLSVSARQELIERIEQKQGTYQEIYDQTDLWNDFGAGVPGSEATLVRLTNLP